MKEKKEIRGRLNMQISLSSEDKCTAKINILLLAETEYLANIMA